MTYSSKPNATCSMQIQGLGHPQDTVAAFNDATGRTIQEVLEVYDRAIHRSLIVVV